MFKNIKNFSKERKKIQKIGVNSLYIGIFLLPTAPAISVFFFLISLLFSENNNPITFLKAKSNRIFIIVSVLMVLSCFYNYFDNTNLVREQIKSLSWISLINWIPFFWCFWGFEPYLRESHRRIKISKLLVIGTIPVIISGFFQYFFEITGPFKLFNGLIIWYQQPISITDGITGPFNNANYAGSWLALVFPFSIALLRLNKSKFEKFVIFLICLSFIFSILLTNSRNSWIGMLISIQIMLGFESILWIIPSFVLISLIATFILAFIPLSIRESLISFSPINIFNNFPDRSTPLDISFPRLAIWKFSIEEIFKRPFFGLGGGSFPFVYKIYNNAWFGHPHSIILEIAFSYGLLTAIILTSNIGNYLFKFYKLLIINSKNKLKKASLSFNFEKAWFSSILFLTYSHLFDIQYFDLRISIICWVLLSGVKASMN